jgi:NAD(P)-dependent dehydrogenase (short-subunit alcohol dehydrogenase family)
MVRLLGGCDSVVANAGVVDTIHRAERFPEEAWRLDLETNLSGQFHLVQAVFEALAASGDGRVVLISSASAETGLPGQVAYTAAKAGVVGMARTLAAEWGPRGICCNVVMPGMIATPKVRALPGALRDDLARRIPLGRFGETEELAGVVAFLLSPAAAYINGTVIRVDGGFGLATGGLMAGQRSQ